MTNEEFIESIRLEGEEWKDIAGYEGMYMISTFGRVASFARLVTGSRRKCLRTSPHKLLLNRLSTTRNGGYYYTTLSKDGKDDRKYIHRLLAQTFIPNPHALKEVDHIDGDPHNNSLDNLRWVSHKENLNNGITIKRFLDIPPALKNQHKVAVVSIKDGVITRHDRMTLPGFSASAISRCCNGAQKTHKGFRWMLLSDYESLVSMSKNSTNLSAD